MPSAYSLLVGLAGLAPALALGTGQKFKIVDGGRSFDRFITIWLENQVRLLALPRLWSLLLLQIPDSRLRKAGWMRY